MLLLYGCGGSHHSQTANTAPQSGATTQSVATTGPATGTTTDAAATTSIGAQEVKPPNPAKTNGLVPATFKIGAGGALTPPTVSSPPKFNVKLTVISADGKAHTVLIRTPTPRKLNVPAGGKSAIELKGLRNGNYIIDVDGVAKGGLAVGSQPGP